MKVLTLAVLLGVLCADRGHGFKCYRCSSNSSFEDCSKVVSAIKCEELAGLNGLGGTAMAGMLNVSFACTKVSLDGPLGRQFIKTCIPSLTERQFCTLLTNQTQTLVSGMAVKECKVCHKELCNGAPATEWRPAVLASSVTLTCYLISLLLFK
ncbi:uncharacterized protein LOC128271766 [Anopheles cruzii]|uniref:uncharacterized protein LOC128271766 n=1 Tax=Anopheles cruzii TaxID=68878 RepID=UPI0022EC5682|nr:uncharacterized protein LOC128271766 [Anopheles cruzii]